MHKFNHMTGTSELNDPEDEVIDFSNAVLYVGALQTIFATSAASMVSLLSCWLLPTEAISAVRTLLLSSMVAAWLVRKPFRLGRVRGLCLIFSALRPCVVIYLVSMVLEQLVHTCTRDSASPSWRRIVFHCSILVAMISGFARAIKPLEQTDAPFLVTSAALFVIAMLPPPAVILSGPLCAEPTFNSSAERLARSLVFSLLYCTFVYASAPPVPSPGEVLVCVMRASAASLWTLGCHVLFLPLATIQAMIVIYVRLYSSDYQAVAEDSPLMTQSVGKADEYDDMERSQNDVVSSSRSCDSNVPIVPVCEPTQTTEHRQQLIPTRSDVISPSFSAFGSRNLVDIGAVGASNTDLVATGGAAFGSGPNGMSKERMAAIAAQIEQDPT